MQAFVVNLINGLGYGFGFGLGMIAAVAVVRALFHFNICIGP